MVMGKKLVVLVVVMVAVFEGSRALNLCGMNDDGLVACKPSVTKPNPVDPSQQCCKALKGADLTCLCSYKNSLMLPSLGIDPDLAMGLAPKCSLKTPDGC